MAEMKTTTTSMERRPEVRYTLVEGNTSKGTTDGDDYAKNEKVRLEMQLVDDMPDSKNRNNSKLYLYTAASAANIAAFVCGTAFGWTSPEIPKLKGNGTDINPLPTPLSTAQETWVGSLLPIGAAIGPFAAGIAADRFGRKATLLASIAPFIVSFLLCSYAKHVNLFYIARFLNGFGVGGVFTVLPMFVGEISEDSVRGALGSFMQLFITFGLLFSYGIGPFTTIAHFNFACVIAPILFLVSFLNVPESPYYLIAVGDKTKAENALKKLRSSENVEKELELIKKTVEESLANKASFFDIFKSRGLTKALIISLALVTFQQFSGINVILFYTQTIFEATGSSIPPEIATIIIGVVQIIGSLITPIFVDKKGKRFLLLISAVGMAISEIVLGVYFYLLERKVDLQPFFWLPVLSLIVYMLTYCFGFGPLPWAVMGELFPANVKSSASTVTASFCWILAFFITKFFANMVDLLGTSGSFWLFSVGCVAAGVFVYTFLPETSGKSLQEIQEILQK